MLETKDGVNLEDIKKFNSSTLYLLGAINYFCETHGMECLVTSIISDRDGLPTTSTTHAEGRGFDLRTRNMTYDQILMLANFVNEILGPFCAVDIHGDPRGAVIEDSHIHIQGARGE
jgi:hypothetical protein